MGGNGLWCRGNFNKIVFDGTVENVGLGIGAGIQGSQGVSGVTVSSYDLSHYVQKM